MEFGHFIAHDISLTSQVSQDRPEDSSRNLLQAELDCCSPQVTALEDELPESLKRCFNIDISADRVGSAPLQLLLTLPLQFYRDAGRSCHSFTRSDSRCLATGSGIRHGPS